MAVITTGAFAKLLWPGINSVFGGAYDEWPVEWSQIFPTYSSDKAYEEDVQYEGLGLPQVKNEGAAVAYDQMRQVFTQVYKNVTWALGFQVTREMFEDKQYAIIDKRARELAFSMRQGEEVTHANILNRAFSSTINTGADGLELCSTVHLKSGGGTYANELTTAAVLTEASLEQVCIDISGLENDRSLKISVMPECLIVPRQLGFTAERILNSALQNDSANNAINALKSLSSIPKGVKMNHYLTDANNWFVKTNCPDGLKSFQRRKLEFDMDNDTDTQNAKFLATQRYIPYWSDARGIFGSAPA